jgi:cardiolipin synthase (CMP-forming)
VSTRNLPLASKLSFKRHRHTGYSPVNVKWIPNALSFGRILVAPLVAWLIYTGMVHDNFVQLQWAFGLFVVSALTDWFDGYLARVLDAKSELGGKLDLWGDKLLVGLTLVAMWLGWLNLGNEYPNPLDGMMADPAGALIGVLLIVALPIRDAYITKLRAQLEVRGVFVSPTFLAKSKTAVVMAGMGVILAGLAHSMLNVALVGLVVLGIGAALSVWTAMSYIRAGQAKQV